MDPSYLIRILDPPPSQSPDVRSFVGGRPALPPSVPLPDCGLCGARQSFFFQVAFPEDHAWAGVSLAVFQCTSCRDRDFLVPLINQDLIPSMKGSLEPGQDIPDGALDLCQINCRFLTFPTEQGVLRDDYDERVRYRPIELVRREWPDLRTSRSKVGGRPGWIVRDASPGLYLGRPMHFLMQIRQYAEYPILPTAPLPYHPDRDDPRVRAVLTEYDLFVGCQLYFFGNHVDGRYHVYMVTQLDR